MSNSTHLEQKGPEAPARPVPLPKTRLEKTQSLLTVISTSIGLLGIAGSTFAFAVSTFYTGSVDLRPDFETPGLVVKVYTSEGHESVFHTKHLNLMPGNYHLEISSPNGRVVHRDTKVRFHQTNAIDVKLGPPPQDSTISSADAANAGSNSSTESNPSAVNPNGLGAVINFGQVEAAASKTTLGLGTQKAAGATDAAGRGASDGSTHGSGSEGVVAGGNGAGSDLNSNSSASESDNSTSDPTAKKKWWHIWKKGESGKNSSESSLEPKSNSENTDGN